MRQSKPLLFPSFLFSFFLGLSTLKSDSYFLHTHGDHVRVFTQSDVRTHNRALPSEQHLNTTVALQLLQARHETRRMNSEEWRIQDFSEVRESTPKVDVKSYYLANFSPKLHEIEKIWTPGAPLDPQMQKEMHKLLHQQRGK